LELPGHGQGEFMTGDAGGQPRGRFVPPRTPQILPGLRPGRAVSASLKGGGRGRGLASPQRPEALIAPHARLSSEEDAPPGSPYPTPAARRSRRF
jgi:hypothetical protein